jgi:hypothetical protein
MRYWVELTDEEAEAIRAATGPTPAWDAVRRAVIAQRPELFTLEVTMTEKQIRACAMDTDVWPLTLAAEAWVAEHSKGGGS